MRGATHGQQIYLTALAYTMADDVPQDALALVCSCINIDPL